MQEPLRFGSGQLRCDWCRKVVGRYELDPSRQSSRAEVYQEKIDDGAGYVPTKLGFWGSPTGERIDGPTGFQCGTGGCRPLRPTAMACCDACEDSILTHPGFDDDPTHRPSDWGRDFRDADVHGAIRLV